MTATLEDIKGWYKEGREKKAAFMIVMCDTYDHENYPVFVTDDEDPTEVVKDRSKNMQRADEVYNLSKPFAKQKMCGNRCFDYGDYE